MRVMKLIKDNDR